MANALDHERITMAVNNYIDLVHTFEWSIEYLRTERPDVLTDPVARAKLAELKIDLHLMRALLVCSGNVIAGGGIPTKEGSMGRSGRPPVAVSSRPSWTPRRPVAR